MYLSCLMVLAHIAWILDLGPIIGKNGAAGSAELDRKERPRIAPEMERGRDRGFEESGCPSMLVLPGLAEDSGISPRSFHHLFPLAGIRNGRGAEVPRRRGQ